MKQATATRTFRRSDNKKIVRAGQVIEADDQYIAELSRQRLVYKEKSLDGAPENKTRPIPVAIVRSSVSQAAPVLPETTSKELDDGEVKEKRGKRKKDAEYL